MKRSKTAIFVLAWFASTYVFWIPVNLITDRLTYSYYLYPTVGAVCISLVQGIAWSLGTRGMTQLVIIALILSYLMINLFTFVVLIPGTLWANILCVVPLYSVYCYYLSKVRSGEISTAELRSF